MTDTQSTCCPRCGAEEIKRVEMDCFKEPTQVIIYWECGRISFYYDDDETWSPGDVSDWADNTLAQCYCNSLNNRITFLENKLGHIQFRARPWQGAEQSSAEREIVEMCEIALEKSSPHRQFGSQ